MWWLVPIAVVGAAGAIYAYFDGEAREARTRWEQKRQSVARTIEDHRANIEKHLARARSSSDFRELTDIHFSSHKVADHAYVLLKDARIALETMGRMLVEAKQKREEFERLRQNTRSVEERQRLTVEINMLNDLRQKIFPDKDALKTQRDELLGEVQRLNARTRELKLAIRDRCGQRGAEWYERLEARVRERSGR